MNKQPSRVLWQNVEPANELSVRLTEEASALDLPDEFKTTIREAANRLYDQQNQIGALIMHLMNNTPIDQVVMPLPKSGFTRHELVSCWGVDKNYILLLESAMQNASQSE